MSDQRNDDLARVQAACQTLIEHFDSVQIFATRVETGELDGTVNIQWGAGNWFARYGQVNAWLVKENAAAVKEVNER